MPTMPEIASFQSLHKLSLPKAYVDFLATFDVPRWYLDARGSRIRFVPLKASGSKRLLGLEVPVQLGEKPYPFFRLLSSHLEMWQEFTGQDFFDNVKGDSYDAKAIADSVCIAEDDNGELIFLAGDGAVWAHFHDGCQVELLGASFEEYFAKCRADAT